MKDCMSKGCKDRETIYDPSVLEKYCILALYFALGANIEIRDAVGDDNIFIFGLTADEVITYRSQGYNPWDYYNSSFGFN